MKTERFDDPNEFRQHADLLADEAVNNLIIGVSGDAAGKNPTYTTFRGWVVYDDGVPVGAAAQTPPHNLILARCRSPEAVDALGSGISDVPGVIGPLPEVERFLAHYPGATKIRSQGIYQLTSLSGEVDENWRRADSRDRNLLLNWLEQFHREAVPEVDVERMKQNFTRRLDSPEVEAGIWIHEDNGIPVAMSGYGGATPNGVRIGPVFTPSQHRGHGYASRLVASQSKWLLDNGREFCFLYTDLANPTSNSIYQRIGYRMIAESAEYTFSRTI